LYGDYLKLVNYISVMLIFFALIFFGADMAAASTRGPGLFGSHETKSTDLSAFKKWNSALVRIKKDLANKVVQERNCRDGVSRKCYMDDWRSFLAFLKDKPVDRQISEINSYMNKYPYITDIVNWHVQDYWESIRQFLTRDGDCEDYAIAKYVSLKELGFNVDNMRIVVVRDTSLNIAHALLVVYFKGKRLILDNQIPYVALAKSVLHYRPYYSINEHAWWLHTM